MKVAVFVLSLVLAVCAHETYRAEELNNGDPRQPGPGEVKFTLRADPDCDNDNFMRTWMMHGPDDCTTPPQGNMGRSLQVEKGPDIGIGSVTVCQHHLCSNTGESGKVDQCLQVKIPDNGCIVDPFGNPKPIFSVTYGDGNWAWDDFRP
uniref:Secreted protein n=1 Tax=viral metagenome TaxID=1070528 RepID=A0A2V0RB40_9ZZZZ